MAKTYQNPIIMFSTHSPEWVKITCMKINIVANKILPKVLLHILNASKSSREWRRKEKIRMEKRKKNNDAYNVCNVGYDYFWI